MLRREPRPHPGPRPGCSCPRTCCTAESSPAEEVAGEVSFYSPVAVDARTCLGQEEITLVSTWDTLYAPPGLDGELARLPVETMYAGPAEAAHGEWVRVENALVGIDPDTLHPGVRGYYEEQGLL